MMLGMTMRNERRRKPVISLTGTLARALRPGMPAVYLYQGLLIRTSAVEAILEADREHVRFETRNSIYSISYFDPEGLDTGLSA